jgi:hypothetical protein
MVNSVPPLRYQFRISPIKCFIKMPEMIRASSTKKKCFSVNPSRVMADIEEYIRTPSWKAKKLSSNAIVEEMPMIWRADESYCGYCYYLRKRAMHMLFFAQVPPLVTFDGWCIS